MSTQASPTGKRAVGKISLSRLKWIATVAPVGFLALLVYLLRGPADEDLHQFPYLVVVAVVSVIVCGFSFFVFWIIERLERRVLQQNQHLSVLNEIATAATETLELDEFLNTALDKVLEATRAEAGLIWLIEEETQELIVQCHRGLHDEQVSELRRPGPAQQQIAEGAVRTGRAFVIERLRDDPDAAEVMERNGFRSAISLPLKAEGEVYGVLGLITRGEQTFEPTEVEFLSSIAGELGLATRSARLHERVLDRAVLEERERLGRELHDSLGQMVGYVNTQTLAVKKLLAAGSREEAERHLAAMEKASQRVGADVREAILGLRTSGRGLLPSLRMYLADYGRIVDTPVVVEVKTNGEALGLRRSTEIQLMRIVQEALSNVRKHACAGKATVRIAAVEDQLIVEIADDGRGFDRDDPSATAWPHFGLETMRERAESIGAAFAIVSHPGAGTTVTVRVPLGQPTEAAHARPTG